MTGKRRSNHRSSSVHTWWVWAAFAVLSLVAGLLVAADPTLSPAQAQQRPTFTASWSANSIPENGSATVTVTTTDASVTDATNILVTLQVGRNESTADTSDIEVLDYLDNVVAPDQMTATSHHQGGWLYIKLSGSTFSYGQAKTKAFTVRAVDDSDTDVEDLVVWVYVNGYLAGSQTLNLTTDPAFTFGATSYTATEGGTAATVQVRLPEAPSASVSIPLTVTRNGGATTADHSTVPSTVTFGTSDTSKTFTVTATDDTVDDSGESITISFGTAPTGYAAIGTTTVNLADNDQPIAVTFAATSYTAFEGGTAATVEVSLSRAPAASVSIPLTVTRNGGATTADHSAVPATVTFGTSDTSKTFTVTATDDTVDDSGESITISFGTAPSGYIASGTTTVNLIDNETGALVDNTNRNQSNFLSLATQDLAQRFTTGTHAAGYTVTSIDVLLNLHPSSGTDTAAPIVKLVSGTAPHTGTTTTFTGPTSLTGGGAEVYTFAAPANTTLSASTNYWVLFEVAASGGGDVQVENTDEPGQLDAAAAGWSIESKYLSRTADSGGAFSEHQNRSLIFGVNGSFVGGI